MKKAVKLSALAALGLVTGAMGHVEAAPAIDTTMVKCTPPSQADIKSLFAQIDADHQKMFNSMDCEHQNLAIKMAKQSCKGHNSCKGQNACKSSSNDCAGKGGCAGTAVKPFEDKNIAVETAKNFDMSNMANKRTQAIK
jgi:hypothetical protein